MRIQDFNIDVLEHYNSLSSPKSACGDALKLYLFSLRSGQIGCSEKDEAGYAKLDNFSKYTLVILFNYSSYHLAQSEYHSITP